MAAVGLCNNGGFDVVGCSRARRNAAAAASDVRNVGRVKLEADVTWWLRLRARVECGRDVCGILLRVVG